MQGCRQVDLSRALLRLRRAEGRRASAAQEERGEGIGLTKSRCLRCCDLARKRTQSLTKAFSAPSPRRR